MYTHVHTVFYFGSAHDHMYLDMGSETLDLKVCELHRMSEVTSRWAPGMTFNLVVLDCPKENDI